MPRRPRMYLPGYAYHVVQRGNNRAPCFFAEQDHRFYIQLLQEVMPLYGNRLHAYCLMTNHVHFLMTPDRPSGISAQMRVVGSRFACYMNKKYARTGTLWEGRHKSSVVDDEGYLLKCYRYIELNPVAAGIVKNPGDYPWTSYHANAWGVDDALISEHPNYELLGNSKGMQCFYYRELFEQVLTGEDIHAISRSLHYSMPVGSALFEKQIENELGRPLGQIGRGRPRRKVDQKIIPPSPF